jgi:uncharacterized protein
LKRLGVRQVRVRHHGDTARIEVESRDFELMQNRKAEIAAHLKKLGFPNVVLDPDGYKTAIVSEARP